MADLEIGVMLNNLERDRLKAFRVAATCGFRVVHTSALPEGWLTGSERARYVAAARDSGLAIHTMFVGFDGQTYADLPAIRRTVGLVIPELREHRTRVALLYCDLARELGVRSLGAHIGFIPPERCHPEYGALVQALRLILDRCAEHGQTFHLETGQEPAELLLQFIQDVERPNLGINFDPANMILYGTGEPLMALDLLAPHVRGVHCKDALPSSDRAVLGTEVPIGQGAVDFRAMLRKLHLIGYCGPVVIEREHGPHVVEDVAASRAYLERLVREVAGSG
jgi:sugar phosphate isomerase/epimerase